MTGGAFAVEDGDEDIMKCSKCKKYIADSEFDNMYYTENCCHMFHITCLESEIMR